MPGDATFVKKDIQRNAASLASGGLGVRFGFLDRYTGSVELAKPNHRTGGLDDPSWRLFFNLSGAF